MKMVFQKKIQKKREQLNFLEIFEIIPDEDKS